MLEKKFFFEACPWILDRRVNLMLAPHFTDVENEAQGSQARQRQKLNISREPELLFLEAFLMLTIHLPTLLQTLFTPNFSLPCSTYMPGQ